MYRCTKHTHVKYIKKRLESVHFYPWEGLECLQESLSFGWRGYLVQTSRFNSSNKLNIHIHLPQKIFPLAEPSKQTLGPNQEKGPLTVMVKHCLNARLPSIHVKMRLNPPIPSNWLLRIEISTAPFTKCPHIHSFYFKHTLIYFSFEQQTLLLCFHKLGITLHIERKLKKDILSTHDTFWK